MRSAARRVSTCTSIVVACALLVAATPVQVRNLAGALADPLRPSPSTRATVLLFVSVDCPISNRYAPEIQRLTQTFAAKGVRFFLVYPNPSDSPATIRQHLKAYGYPDIALRDPGHELVKLAHASVTPEAAVFDSRSTLVYHGRIDDRVVDLGHERPAASTHDLHDALTAALAGKPVVPSATPAFGCFLADLK